MSVMKINKENLKKHGNLFASAMQSFTDDSVYLDRDVCFPAYSSLAEAMSFAADLRSDTSAGTTHEIGNINYLVSLMDGVDSGAVTAAKALREEE